jgi:hypothetical protein
MKKIWLSLLLQQEKLQYSNVNKLQYYLCDHTKRREAVHSLTFYV